MRSRMVKMVVVAFCLSLFMAAVARAEEAGDAKATSEPAATAASSSQNQSDEAQAQQYIQEQLEVAKAKLEKLQVGISTGTCRLPSGKSA